MADLSALSTNWQQDVKRSQAQFARQEGSESGEAAIAAAILASLLVGWAIVGARHLAPRTNPMVLVFCNWR